MRGYVFLMVFVLATIGGAVSTTGSVNNANATIAISSTDGLKQALLYSHVDNHEYDFYEYNCEHFTNALVTELKYMGFDAGKAMIVIHDATEHFPADVISNHDDSAIFCHDVVWIEIDGEYIFVEPQTDEIIQLSDSNYKEVLIINSTTGQLIEAIPC